jgi:hypothetical protein
LTYRARSFARRASDAAARKQTSTPFQVVILAQLFQFEDEIADEISHLRAISGNFGRDWR